MKTIIINEKTKKGKLIVDLIKEMNAGIILDDTDYSPNQTTIDAIEEARTGYTTKCNDFEDYLRKVQ